MERRISAEDTCRLLDSALVTIARLTKAVQSFVVQKELPPPLPVCAPVLRAETPRPAMKALIPLSVLQEAQRISQKPNRKRQRQQPRQRPVEVIYRRPLSLVG